MNEANDLVLEIVGDLAQTLIDIEGKVETLPEAKNAARECLRRNADKLEPWKGGE